MKGPATGSVKTTAGQLSGVTVEGGIRAFKGVPFAAPPTGNLRWKPPQPPAKWKGVRQCIEYGPACPQPKVSMFFSAGYDDVSEDCLYLNVWAPSTGAGKLPVMVWIHGGAFMTGSGSDNLFDGRSLATRGVVVVTINYRLGPFGFFAHPLLSKESGHNASGNYGLLDQVAALKWVRDNIAAFGGDPRCVTIFGESGGGRSVAHLMTCPMAKGLFHRAIMQSSTAYRPIHHLRESWYGRPSMETVGESAAQRLRCDKKANPLAALRAESAKSILKATEPTLAATADATGKGTPYEPIVDGYVVPADPADMFDAGKQYRVPLLAGSNADEGSLFISKMRLFKPARMRARVVETYPKYADTIFKLYPMRDRYSGFKAMNLITGDMSSTAPMRRTVRNMAKIGTKAWLYHFTYTRSDFMGKRFGAWHGSDIRFVFDNLEGGRPKVTASDSRVADTMSALWVQFATTGDPNGPGRPQWPPYERAKEPYLEIGDRNQVKYSLRKASCDIFERIEADKRSNRKAAPQK